MPIATIKKKKKKIDRVTIVATDAVEDEVSVKSEEEERYKTNSSIMITANECYDVY